MKFGGWEKGDSERPGDSDVKRLLGVDDIEGFVGANLRRVSEDVDEPPPAEWDVVDVDVPRSSARSAAVFSALRSSN